MIHVVPVERLRNYFFNFPCVIKKLFKLTTFAYFYIIVSNSRNSHFRKAWSDFSLSTIWCVALTSLICFTFILLESLHTPTGLIICITFLEIANSENIDTHNSMTHVGTFTYFDFVKKKCSIFDKIRNFYWTKNLQ